MGVKLGGVRVCVCVQRKTLLMWTDAFIAVFWQADSGQSEMTKKGQQTSDAPDTHTNCVRSSKVTWPKK